MASSTTGQMVVAGKKWTDGDTLEVDDLVMYTGHVSEHSVLHHRIIYRVAEKEEIDSPWATHHYKYRAVFDFENPLGTDMSLTGHLSARDMKRLSLVDLGVIRLLFDHFIVEYARRQGNVVEHMPTVEDVKGDEKDASTR